MLDYVQRIKFSDLDKRPYQQQINILKTNVRTYISDHTGCSVTKIIQSGSWKKGTILKPRDGVELDIDLVFFINPGESTERDVRELNQGIREFLYQVYPNKTEDDFWDSAKSSGVVFKGTGLSFDIVPVVPVQPEPYVWQPESGTRGFYFTSIDGQLTFNSSLKTQNSNYASIVRILKKWKNEKDLSISSFTIEIIQGWLDCTKGYDITIEQSVIRFFDLVSRYRFPQISFNTPGADTEISTDSLGAIYVADPTNKGNNTAEYIDTPMWEEIQSQAAIAYETLVYAQEVNTKGDTTDLWKEILGNTFNIENQN
ncbi:MAG: nucleotidyltransferase [Cyclobacteriaceae bacterium]